MSGVFQNIENIDHPHLTARRLCTPPPLVRGRTHSLGGEGGGGVNILEDARHCSVLYICKYFVGSPDVSLLLQIAQFCLLTHTKTLRHNIFLAQNKNANVENQAFLTTFIQIGSTHRHPSANTSIKATSLSSLSVQSFSVWQVEVLPLFAGRRWERSSFEWK